MIDNRRYCGNYHVDAAGIPLDDRELVGNARDNPNPIIPGPLTTITGTESAESEQQSGIVGVAAIDSSSVDVALGKAESAVVNQPRICILLTLKHALPWYSNVTFLDNREVIIFA